MSHNHAAWEAITRRREEIAFRDALALGAKYPHLVEQADKALEVWRNDREKEKRENLAKMLMEDKA